MANYFFPVMLTLVVLLLGQSGQANTNKSSTYYNTKSTDASKTSDNRSREIKKDQRITADTQAQGSDADIETTRKIRERLVEDSALSLQAQNVQIITLNKIITLKGQVNKQSERNKIVAIAQEVGGTENVNSQFLVAK